MKLNELLYVQRYAVGLNEPADYIGLMQRYEQFAQQRRSEVDGYHRLRAVGGPVALAILVCFGTSSVAVVPFLVFLPVLLVVIWLSWSRSSATVESAFYQKELAEFHAVEISKWLKSKGVEHTAPSSGNSGA